MTKKELIDQWLLINTRLNNGLMRLSELDKEREYLLATNSGDTERMQNSLDSYKNLASEMKLVRTESDALKQKLYEILTEKEWNDLMGSN